MFFSPATAAPFGFAYAHPRALMAGLARLWGYMRNIVFAACLFFPVAVVLQADEAPQAWVPEVLELPADMEVLEERAIGSSLRMFKFSTNRAADPLLTEWEEALRGDGYEIHQMDGSAVGQMIEFSGQDINNAKIVVSPTADGERTVIDFDATLQ